MAAALPFVGMLLLSVVVALLAAMSLADHFRTNEEFVVIAAAIVAYGLIVTIAFAVASAFAANPRILKFAAVALAVLAVAIGILLGSNKWIADLSSNPYTVGEQQLAMTLEFIIPSWLIVLIQWGLVRRRWLRARAEEDLTVWPWVTTVIAGFVVLNPVGLAFVSSAIQQSPTDWLWELALWVTVGATLALLLAASIECYIRLRMLRRRLGGTI